MTDFRVVFRREAIQHLEELYAFVASNGSLVNATRFTDEIITYCEGLASFPFRGTTRDDIRPGLRTIGYKKRVVIAFTVVEDSVAILGVFYGGRDYEDLLHD